MDRASDYAIFSKLYRGRSDRVGHWRDGAYYPMAGGFSFERFCDHVDLREKYALYAADDLGRVCFGLFDFDVLPRDQGWGSILPRLGEEKAKVFRVVEHLRALGVPDEAMLVEFPTVGYHLLLFFDEPVPAREVRAFMRSALEASGCADTPSYPKKVDATGPGDRIQLPFRINKNTGRRSNLVRHLETFDPENYDPTPDFLPLKQVVPLPALPVWRRAPRA